MTKDADFKLLKIQTIILKVNIDCDGCRLKVKKLLQRIEGVYTVSIDAECQKVTVSGNVDSATLIKKLARSGKHAELWSKKSSTQVNNNNNNKDQRKQNIMQSLKALKNHDNFSSDEDEDCEDDDALRFLESKMKNQLTNGKKNGYIGGLHQVQQQQQQQGRNQPGMMMNLQGNQNHSSSLMNLRGHNSNVMMPQIVYHKATQMPPLTGYYYNGSSDYETHLFSDENTNGCVVM